ncbi:3-oxoadipate enol-lactonase [Gordonia sp. CPCC 206044]|uniref:3-oxoadipate enol-lactonase n=1 Tax=Gordonia sp. CPCC 206044 TaxID=3140793 RepID=UPI003AF3F2DB
MSAVEVEAVVSGRPDGPAVVLSNSLGSTYQMWDAQLAALETGFRVVRYNTRGHGGSPVPQGPYTIDDLADDVIALLDRLDIPRAHVVGLSLGGATALRLAVRNPDRVANLGLLCTAAFFPPPSAWTDRAATVRADGTGAVAEAVVQRWFTSEHLEQNPESRTYHEKMVAATPAEGYASCCEVLATMDQRGDLATITAPTLAIAGADDPATPPARLAEIADGVPNGRLMVVPQSAHLANAEQPQIITPALIEHLEQA